MSTKVQWHPQLPVVGHSARCAETFLHICLGPHGIGTRIGEQIIRGTSYSYSEYSIHCAAYNSTPLKPGMTVSNGAPPSPCLRLNFTKKGAEPGYYADGEYGIRIENVVVVREVRHRTTLVTRASSVSST
jgi:Xaa-Pro aminopeptidase